MARKQYSHTDINGRSHAFFMDPCDTSLFIKTATKSSTIASLTFLQGGNVVYGFDVAGTENTAIDWVVNNQLVGEALQTDCHCP